MKYPLDTQAIEEISRDILLHHRSQDELITTLTYLLYEAIEDAEDDEAEWYGKAQKLLKSFNVRKTDFETHRFNQKNGHTIEEKSPYPSDPTEILPGMDLIKENQLNSAEKEFGEEMSENEIAAMFQEEPKKKQKTKKLSKMTLAEIEEWEKAQDNSNDIYKVSARIKNGARMAVKGNLTAQGDMVVNMFTHMIKALYDFADTIPDRETKIKLIELARKQEETPANLIAALSAGVKLK